MGERTRLEAEQRRALDQLTKLPGIDAFYLAGGTAVAYHLGHRVSLDLDLFSFEAATDLEQVRQAAQTDRIGFEVISRTDVMLRGRIAGTPIDFVRYPYPLLEPALEGPLGLRVANLLDLAAMKLATVAGRGLRRDFWDLYEIATARIPLVEAAEAYLRRFGLTQPDLYHVARALTYFVDAERETVYPTGLTVEKWEDIKAFFCREAPSLLAAP